MFSAQNCIHLYMEILENTWGEKAGMVFCCIALYNATSAETTKIIL